MNDNKLNKKLVVEQPTPNYKKSSSVISLLIFLLLICALIVFVILEKLNYIDYLNFI